MAILFIIYNKHIYIHKWILLVTQTYPYLLVFLPLLLFYTELLQLVIHYLLKEYVLVTLP